MLQIQADRVHEIPFKAANSQIHGFLHKPSKSSSHHSYGEIHSLGKQAGHFTWDAGSACINWISSVHYSR